MSTEWNQSYDGAWHVLREDVREPDGTRLTWCGRMIKHPQPKQLPDGAGKVCPMCEKAAVKA